MAKTYCMLCKKKHTSLDWRHKQWIKGQPDGWACSKWFTPSPAKELVDSQTQEDRKKYRNAMVQPFRQGELSKEFTELYPKQTAGMLKSGSITSEQIKKAKPVWKGDL